MEQIGHIFSCKKLALAWVSQIHSTGRNLLGLLWIRHIQFCVRRKVNFAYKWLDHTMSDLTAHIVPICNSVSATLYIYIIYIYYCLKVHCDFSMTVLLCSFYCTCQSNFGMVYTNYTFGSKDKIPFLVYPKWISEHFKTSKLYFVSVDDIFTIFFS